MVLSAGKRVKGFLLAPSETFDVCIDDKCCEAFRYYASRVIRYALFFTIISSLNLGGWLIPEPGIRIDYERAVLDLPFVATFGKGAMFVFPVVFFLLSAVILIVAVIIAGLWTHLWVYIMGGRNGVEQTMNVMMYGATPFLVLGWIPYVECIGLVWTIAVQVIGIRQLHGMSTKRVIAACAISLISISTLGIAVIHACPPFVTI